MPDGNRRDSVACSRRTPNFAKSGQKLRKYLHVNNWDVSAPSFSLLGIKKKRMKSRREQRRLKLVMGIGRENLNNGRKVPVTSGNKGEKGGRRGF